MQHSPTDIKDRLLRGLDEEYNVVDMGVVVEVISILEKMPITKEALEATRLGKWVNLLRKKTDNESLAKRAKNLVKRWRNLVDLTGSSQQNGAAVDKNAVNATHEPLVESVPRTHAANKRLRKTYDDDHMESYEPLKKKSRVNGLTRSQPVIDADSGECSRDTTPAESVPVKFSQPAEVPQEEPPPGPKKRGRKKGSKNRNTLLKVAGIPKPNDDIIKEKIASISRTPKVKTTQELVAMLGSKTGDTLDVATKERSSSLKNSSKLETDQSLSKSSKYLSRSENVQKITKEEDPGSPIIVVDNDDSTVEKLDNPPPEEPPPILPPAQPKFNTPEEILSQLPSLDVDAINWDETPVPSPPETPVVTLDDLDRLHSDYVEGLNGVWEHSTVSDTEVPTESHTFREWQEMVHRRSYRDDLLRILPYTVID